LARSYSAAIFRTSAACNGWPPMDGGEFDTNRIFRAFSRFSHLSQAKIDPSIGALIGSA
jgi:hypothetical protein